ncbi:MAG: lipoate--protein ligase family protein [Haloferacaceae archaeon]
MSGNRDRRSGDDAGPAPSRSDAVRVVRGRAADVDADRAATATLLDRAATATLLDRAAAAGRVGVRAWTPARQVAFGPRDVRDRGFERARRAARRRGYRVVERRVGGRAVAYTGRTVAFARAAPVADARRGLDERYESVVGAVVDALGGLGADVERGEPADSFCPGTHSVRVRGGGKVAGVAQRVREGAALVAGCVLVDDAAAQRSVLGPVYDALGVPFDPDAVGSVAAAGGAADPERVARALEAALVGGRPTRTTPASAVAERTS